MALREPTGDRTFEDSNLPPSWGPRIAGDLILGELVGLRAGATRYGPAKIAVLRRADGQERCVWLLHKVLREEFARAKPAVGNTVAIRYVGHRLGIVGQRYAAYQVFVQRDPTEPDLDALLFEASPPVAT